MSFGSISRLVMSAVYSAAGLALLFTEILSDRITDYRTPAGCALLAYGLLRFVLWWRWHRAQREDQA